jgi:hypothetical protein
LRTGFDRKNEADLCAEQLGGAVYEIDITPGLRTVGGGEELTAYGPASRALVQRQDQELLDAVAGAWQAWREQKARQGDFDEAGQEPPGNLAEVLAPSAEPRQLRLPGL